MGTHALFGFYYKGKYYLAYVQSDGSPSVIGREVFDSLITALETGEVEQWINHLTYDPPKVLGDAYYDEFLDPETGDMIDYEYVIQNLSDIIDRGVVYTDNTATFSSNDWNYVFDIDNMKFDIYRGNKLILSLPVSGQNWQPWKDIDLHNVTSLAESVLENDFDGVSHDLKHLGLTDFIIRSSADPRINALLEDYKFLRNQPLATEFHRYPGTGTTNLMVIAARDYPELLKLHVAELTPALIQHKNNQGKTVLDYLVSESVGPELWQTYVLGQ